MKALRPPARPLADGDLVLRPAGEPDLPALARACADEDLASWVHPPAGSADEAAHRLLDDLRRGWDDGVTASFIDVDPQTGDVLALAALLVGGDPEVGEVAYWVAPGARRRGIATRAVRLLSEWALRERGFERLWLEIEPGNAASHGVAVRAGYSREGLLRSHCRDRRSGRRHDCVVYSLLPGDAPA